MSTEFEFTKQHSLEERKEEADRIRSRYPKRIPVIVEISKGSNLPPLDKCKFLVPEDITISQFSYVLRKRIKLTPETAVFIMINGTFPSVTTEMYHLYDKYKSSDNFMYAKLHPESTFG